MSYDRSVLDRSVGCTDEYIHNQNEPMTHEHPQISSQRSILGVEDYLPSHMEYSASMTRIGTAVRDFVPISACTY